jgi:ribosomal protein S18 acetylase RimI-like enzyme
VTAVRRRDVVVRPFTDDDVPAAGRLLAERHAAHVRSRPLLSPRAAEPRQAQRMVQDLWSSPGADGVVAVDGGSAGDVVGYLVGTAKPGPAWGPNAWVEAAGHAVRSPDVVAALYAAAAERWVAEGRVAHYVLVPATDDDVLAAWSRLGFGGQHVHGIRSTNRADDPGPAADTRVRRALADDVDALARLDLVLTEHQARSPVFSAAPVPRLGTLVDDWREGWSDDRFPTFVAVAADTDAGDGADADADAGEGAARGAEPPPGTVLGATTCCRLEESAMHTGPARVDGAAFLAFAAVFPEHRGRQVAASLTAAVLAWARAQGCAALVADWRSANVLSSRTWSGLGFTETFRRLHRSVGY